MKRLTSSSYEVTRLETARCAVRAPSGRNVPAALTAGDIAARCPTNDFTTADVYSFERELEALHPDNRHVRDKIRQQLQVLRDTGLLPHPDRRRRRFPKPRSSRSKK